MARRGRGRKKKANPLSGSTKKSPLEVPESKKKKFSSIEPNRSRPNRSTLLCSYGSNCTYRSTCRFHHLEDYSPEGYRQYFIAQIVRNKVRFESSDYNLQKRALASLFAHLDRVVSLCPESIKNDNETWSKFESIDFGIVDEDLHFEFTGIKIIFQIHTIGDIQKIKTWIQEFLQKDYPIL